MLTQTFTDKTVMHHNYSAKIYYSLLQYFKYS